MDLPESFQCMACQSFLSHPIDTCPVCGDQFYWMLSTTGEVTEARKKEYLNRVIALVEGRATHEFLTHGDLLWLPYRFWEFDPTGQLLNDLEWVRGVELHQHEKTQDEDYDTQPKMPLPTYVAETVAGEPVETLRAKVVSARREETPKPGARVTEPPQPEPAGSSPLIAPRMFAPLMIALFFVLLSASYLFLHYQKNTRTIEEVSHESVLP